MQRRELCFAVILFCFFCASFARAQDPAIFEGAVVNSVTGQPIAEARVKLMRPDAEPLYARTDAQGRFEFAVSDGRGASVSVERPGFAQRPQRTMIRAGSAATIQLSPVAVIAGKVTDPNGVPVDDCTVEILQKRLVADRRPGGGPAGVPLPGGQYEIVRLNVPRTNDLGEFRAAPLDPGTYYVVANKNGRVSSWPGDYRITYYPRALDLASAKPVELKAGQQARADIQIVSREGVRLRGRLTGAGMETTPAGRLRYTRLMLVPQHNYLMNANGPFTIARSDEFEFSDVLPGSYTLVALTTERPATDVWGGEDKPAFGTTRAIEIKGRDIEGLAVPLAQLRDVPGAITFAEGCTASPVRIMVRSEGPLAVGPRDAASGPDGKFVLRGLSPGTLKLSFMTASPTGVPVFALSMRLGEREVLNDGFVYPFDGDETLKVVLGCPANRRPL